MRGVLLILLSLAWAGALGFLFFGTSGTLTGIAVTSPMWLPESLRWPVAHIMLTVLAFGWIVPLLLGIGSVISQRRD